MSKFILRLVLCIALLLPVVASVQAQDNAATIKSLTGTVKILPKGTKEPIDGEPGMLLYEGDMLRTGDGATVELNMANGAEVNISPNSKFGIDPSKGAKEGIGGIIRLFQGKVRAKTTVAGTRIKINTPMAVCAVRGSTADLDVDEVGRTIIDLIDGIADMVNNFGEIRAGDLNLTCTKGAAATISNKPLENKLEINVPKESRTALVGRVADQRIDISVKATVTIIKDPETSARKVSVPSESQGSVKLYVAGNTTSVNLKPANSVDVKTDPVTASPQVKPSEDNVGTVIVVINNVTINLDAGDNLNVNYNKETGQVTPTATTGTLDVTNADGTKGTITEGQSGETVEAKPVEVPTTTPTPTAPTETTGEEPTEEKKEEAAVTPPPVTTEIVRPEDTVEVSTFKP